MSAARTYDVVVIGAGVNGLAAASYLALAGKRVLVAEASDRLGGGSQTATLGDGNSYSRVAHALYALDPLVIRELRLARHGLKFAVRDMPLVGLRADGKHVVLQRDTQAAARQIAVHSEADALIWARFRREWFGIAREMRALWWQAGKASTESIAGDSRVVRLARTGSAAWLDSWFESEALKATLCFDAHAISPLAAGSSLLLVWRAAQEMSGLQGAVALPRGGLGAVADAFAAAARAASSEIETNAKIGDLLLSGEGAIQGVVLESGEAITAPLVLSSLSRKSTLSFKTVRAALGIATAMGLEQPRQETAMARVTLALDAFPGISGSPIPGDARLVVVERAESLVVAHVASRAGTVPEELTMEVIIRGMDGRNASAGRPCIVSTLIAPVPAEVAGGWHNRKSELAARVVAALARHISGVAGRITGVDVLTPDDMSADDAFGGPVDMSRLLADWRSRVRTPVPGLLLCGAAADPIGAVSGRGGRVAAALAFEQWKAA